jgi:hypothetical protein
MLILHYLKLPNDLLQAGNQMVLVIRQTKNKIADP